MKSETLKWQFDISTFRLIGRELITDRITALFELVKNCYDANSTTVHIEFQHVGKKNQLGKIIIKDNGVGMSLTDIKEKWMVIGTASKRIEKYSPEPFNRRYTGEKGIGRFAVDKLGDVVNIRTKKKGESLSLCVNINWESLNNNIESGSQLKLFTDVENEYYFQPSNIDDHGTTLEISGIRDIWSVSDIERLSKELTKIVSPFHKLEPPFHVSISCKEYPEYENIKVETFGLDLASHSADLAFNEKNQEILAFNEDTGTLYNESTSIKSFGGVKLRLFFFDTEAKRKFNKHYRDTEERIDGVKIYRDGIITTPFAEYEKDRYKQRDVLGIDKRLWQDIFDKISTREVIGIVDISKEGNPSIIDATNRQDFIDNQEYRELKKFIIEQVDVFSKVKIHNRQLKKVDTLAKLEIAKADVKSFVDELGEVAKKNPNLKSDLDNLLETAKRVDNSVKKGIYEQKQSEKEFIRKENIYLSLMSLQEYAASMAHAVRTSIAKVKDMAEFFQRFFPNEAYNAHYMHYSKEIFNEMHNLNKVIDYMLSYAGSNIDFSDIEIESLLNDIFQRNKVALSSENISYQIIIRDNVLITANRQFFFDIFQNLIHNSIKALDQIENKIIKCESYCDKDKLVIIFSDNGSGIDKFQRPKVFDLYYTTTEKMGGAGIGLYIVQTRVKGLKGKIEIIDSEFEPKGISFKLEFPFKK